MVDCRGVYTFGLLNVGGEIEPRLEWQQANQQKTFRFLTMVWHEMHLSACVFGATWLHMTRPESDVAVVLPAVGAWT